MKNESEGYWGVEIGGGDSSEKGSVMDEGKHKTEDKYQC